MSPRILLSHPSGNANVKQAALALAEAGMLEAFWTSVSWGEHDPINAVLPETIQKELMRRSYHESVLKRTKHYPWHEMIRLAFSRLGLGRLTANENAWFSVNHCHVAQDKKVAQQIKTQRKLDAIYAYDHGALDSFKAIRPMGGRCIYDLPTGYWRLLQQIILEEIERQPAWKETAPSLNFPKIVYSRKDEELMLADHIIVASQFTRQSLNRLPQLSAPISVIPYGAPTPSAIRRSHASNPKKLRVLYVGGMKITKGLPYLFDAIKQMGKAVELTLIGERGGKSAALDAALNTHRWIPSLPNQAILEEMNHHDVFVFPSLFDGFGLVILEALSRGLPIITTTHTGGPDIITEGKDGFIIPIRSGDAIAEKLTILFEDREKLAEMSQAALRKAESCSWPNYRKRLIETVLQTISQK